MKSICEAYMHNLIEIFNSTKDNISAVMLWTSLTMLRSIGCYWAIVNSTRKRYKNPRHYRPGIKCGALIDQPTRTQT